MVRLPTGRMALIPVTSAKIWASGLKLDTIMNSSGSPNTRQSRIRTM